MRVAIIRAEAEAALRQIGFRPDTFEWISGPNTLFVAVGGKLKKLAMPGGISRAKLERMLGRIEGYGEFMRTA